MAWDSLRGIDVSDVLQDSLAPQVQDPGRIAGPSLEVTATEGDRPCLAHRPGHLDDVRSFRHRQLAEAAHGDRGLVVNLDLSGLAGRVHDVECPMPFDEFIIDGEPHSNQERGDDADRELAEPRGVMRSLRAEQAAE